MLVLTNLLATAEVGENAEIMVGELQMIFGVDAVAIELRIACQFFVFFQHLGGIATRPIVDAVLIIETAAVVLLLPVAIIVVPSTTPIVVVVVVRLAVTVVIHKG